VSVLEPGGFLIVEVGGNALLEIGVVCAFRIEPVLAELGLART
jgi:hypothetical protein